MEIYNNITFLILIFIVFPVLSTAQNLALHKSYTLSVSPNYPHTAPASDKTSLTDGIYTKGYFWGQATTVGWEHVPVIITIDLENPQPISAVTFNTVRRQDQFVNFPKNIFVFASNDNNHFQYVGDAAEDTGNVRGPYLVKKIALTNIRAIGRYVRLSVIPNGTFLFCDEIEVMKGNATVLSRPLISKDSLKLIEDSVKNVAFLKQNLKKSIGRLQNITGNKAGNTSLRLTRMHDELEKQDISEADLNNLKNEVGLINAKCSTRFTRSSFLLESYNPWDTLDQMYYPGNATSSLKYNFNIPVNFVEYGSFVLMNKSTSAKTFSLNLDNKGSSSQIELFNALFVPSINGEEIPDPLIKVTGNIEIAAGYTNLLLFRITGKEPGSSNITLLIQSNGEKKRINIKANVFDLHCDQTDQMVNANVWAYFTSPMIKDRKNDAMSDLLDHHVNTIVIPPAVIPNLESKDYSTLNNYLSNIRGVENILLFMNYGQPLIRNGYKNGTFLSSGWKEKFKNWFNSITGDIKANGLNNSQILLYPYDEISGNNVVDFKNLILWAKSAIPGIKFYATLADQAAVNALLPLLDVAQIHPNFSGINRLPSHKCQIWIYSGSAPSRELSPYSFYRLMSWQAFENDYQGIGFWNYADEGIGKNLNLVSDPLIYPSNSYSVIYDGPDQQTISTRRWEAFRLGIEDYSILQLYANKVGEEKAKALAKEVLNNPFDLNKAGSVRNLILSQLFGQ